MLRFGHPLIKIVAAACRRRRASRTSREISAALAASAEQDQIAGHDFGHVLFLPRRLVIPGTGLQASLDVDLADVPSNACELPGAFAQKAR